MRALLRNVLKQECDKHVERHFEYLYQLTEYAKRKSRREGLAYKPTVKLRPWWNAAPGFNPFKVRVVRKLNTYATTLADAIRRRKYKPRPAVIRYVPKSNGGRRRLNIFQLPDAAVSNLVYKSLLNKNSARFSAYAYAYREDRTVHDAVTEIFNDFRKLDRIYVAEYDFTGFFDQIEHKYLWQVIDSERFVISPDERYIVSSFLSSSACELPNYPSNAQARNKGIPQGTSVSLFLANVACWELDRGLERLGVRFARYADDTLIWSEDYEKVVQAYYLINQCAKRMGVPINAAKSHGISLLTSSGKSHEMTHKTNINFLGYTIGLEHIAINEKKIRDIKSRISYLVYQNLIQPLKSGIFNDLRLISGLDLDYATALRQIRFYMYGGLTQEKLNEYLSGKVANLNFRGVMSYYPVVNDIDQLAHLDGWVVHVLRQSLRLREKLWKTQGVGLPGPKTNWIEQLDMFTYVTDPTTGKPVDFRIPSFRLMQRAMSLAISRRGIMAVANPASRYY